MLAHTPYDGSSRPFTIGVRPLDPARWIEPDKNRARFLAEKRRLFADARNEVFVERDDMRDSQIEVHDALAAYLKEGHPGILAEGGPVFDDGEAPLVQAALLVQDDLAIMRRFDDGWRLAAAAICFPSSWTLREKFDRTLADIHAPVPGFAGAMEQRVTRIFDNLRVDAPVERFNWSIYANDALRHADPEPAPHDASGFIRVERQTLRRMPRSGDILFIIRILVDPLAAFRTHREGAALAASLREQVLAMTPAQLAYKGMSEARDDLAAALAVMAREAG